MGPVAEVAADQQRLPQLADVSPGRLRNGVDAALGDVDAQTGELRQPDVCQQQVGDQEPGSQQPAPVAAGAAVRSPALNLQGMNVCGKENRQQGGVVVEIPEIEHAAGDGLEA